MNSRIKLFAYGGLMPRWFFHFGFDFFLMRPRYGASLNFLLWFFTIGMETQCQKDNQRKQPQKKTN